MVLDITIIFFEDTTDPERHRHMILFPFMALLTEDEITHTHLQQDSATAHTAHISMALLRDVFGDRLISRHNWPPRSPDFLPLIFIYGEQRKVLFTEMILVVSVTWRKTLLGIFPTQNWYNSLPTR
jgi:hypothetical protein